MLETLLSRSSWPSPAVGMSVVSPGSAGAPGVGVLGLKGLNCDQKFVLGVSPGASVPGFSRVNQKKASIARAMRRMINKFLIRLDMNYDFKPSHVPVVYCASLINLLKCIASFLVIQYPPQPKPLFVNNCTKAAGMSVTHGEGASLYGLELGLMSTDNPKACAEAMGGLELVALLGLYPPTDVTA